MVLDYSGLTVHNGASAHSKGTCDWCPLSRKTGKLIELTSLVCQSVVSHVPATGAPYLAVRPSVRLYGRTFIQSTGIYRSLCSVLY